MSEDRTLATAARFGGLAATYDRYRPTYPSEALAAILDGLPIGPTIVDIGAGTGISTRALAAAGAHAIAIEPNAEMRAVATASGVDARAGTADATALADRCCEAVACFQSFHWFADARTLHEFRRILRPDGRVALVWNERDARDAFTADYAAVERKHCASGGVAAIDFPDNLASELLAAHGFSNVRRQSFANPIGMDLDHVLGRARSTSYAPKAGAELDAFLDALREVHARRASPAGLVTFHYRTDVTLGESAPP